MNDSKHIRHRAGLDRNWETAVDLALAVRADCMEGWHSLLTCEPRRIREWATDEMIIALQQLASLAMNEAMSHSDAKVRSVAELEQN